MSVTVHAQKKKGTLSPSPSSSKHSYLTLGSHWLKKGDHIVSASKDLTIFNNKKLGTKATGNLGFDGTWQKYILPRIKGNQQEKAFILTSSFITFILEEKPTSVFTIV